LSSDHPIVRTVPLNFDAFARRGRGGGGYWREVRAGLSGLTMETQLDVEMGDGAVGMDVDLFERRLVAAVQYVRKEALKAKRRLSFRVSRDLENGRLFHIRKVVDEVHVKEVQGLLQLEADEAPPSEG